MTVKIDRPGEIGEYDESLQALLQIVWGDGFLSPGGPAEVAKVLEGVDIRGLRVLDIGSGLGAVDVLLVEQHGAGHVLGIDLEPDLITKARARVRAAGFDGRIEFRQVTAGALPLAVASVDVVFSKDAMVQIPDKPALYAEVHRVLRPGGRFIASDWLRGGNGDYSPQMLEFFRLEGITYNLASAEATVGALRQAGFVDVEVRDRNDWYRELARRELDAMRSSWNPMMIERLGADKARHFVENWRQLVRVLDLGELRPSHLRANADRSIDSAA